MHGLGDSLSGGNLDDAAVGDRLAVNHDIGTVGIRLVVDEQTVVDVLVNLGCVRETQCVVRRAASGDIGQDGHVDRNLRYFDLHRGLHDSGAWLEVLCHRLSLVGAAGLATTGVEDGSVGIVLQHVDRECVVVAVLSQRVAERGHSRFAVLIGLMASARGLVLDGAVQTELVDFKSKAVLHDESCRDVPVPGVGGTALRLGRRADGRTRVERDVVADEVFLAVFESLHLGFLVLRKVFRPVLNLAVHPLHAVGYECAVLQQELPRLQGVSIGGGRLVELRREYGVGAVGSVVRIVSREQGEVYRVLAVVDVTVDLGLRLYGGKQSLADELEVGHEHVFNVVLCVAEHGVEVHARGDNVLQPQLYLASRRDALEADVAGLAEDEVRARTDEYVALCTHILRGSRGADGAGHRGGGGLRHRVLAR